MKLGELAGKLQFECNQNEMKWSKVVMWLGGGRSELVKCEGKHLKTKKIVLLPFTEYWLQSAHAALLLVIRFLLRKSTTIDHITHSMRLIWKHVSKHTLARKFNFIQCTIAPYCLKSFWCHYHFHVWCNTSISCNIITHMYVLMATNFPLSTTIATKLKCLSLQIFTCKFILLFIRKLHGNCSVIVMRDISNEIHFTSE